jgi:hypothetical protein
MMKLLPIEKAVLDKLLSGDFRLLVALRNQLEHCAVVSREVTGYGFYLTLAVPENMPKIAGLDAKFGDVVATLPGLINGAGFLLYLKNGLLDMLEGYSFDEPWPISTDVFDLKYINDCMRDWGDLSNTLSRNLVV